MFILSLTLETRNWAIYIKRQDIFDNLTEDWMIYFPNKVDTLGTEIKMSLSLCHNEMSDHNYIII